MKRTPAAGSKIQVSINGSYTTIPGVEGIPEFGPDRAWIDATAIDDTAKQWTADLPDLGEFTLQGQWDSKDVTHAYLLASSLNAQAPVEAVKVVFNSGATCTLSGIVGSFRTSGNKGKNEMFSCKIKAQGTPNYSPAP